MINMDEVLEYISALNVCHTRFCNAHKCKGTNLKYVLFNVLQWHKTLRAHPWLNHWKPDDVLGGNWALKTHLPCSSRRAPGGG